MSDERSLGRVLDLVVYAPVGVLVELRERLPGRVRQRRQAFENRVQLARFIGQIAVQQGQKELAKRLHPAPAPGIVTTAEPALIATNPIATMSMVLPVEVPVEAVSLPIEAVNLPIPEYESLAAIHVVERLGSLRPDELEAVRSFEQGHRARRTVLAKVTQLQEAT